MIVEPFVKGTLCLVTYSGINLEILYLTKCKKDTIIRLLNSIKMLTLPSIQIPYLGKIPNRRILFCSRNNVLLNIFNSLFR